MIRHERIVDEPFRNEVLELYESVTDEAKWRAVLQRIGERLGADGMALHFGESAAFTLAHGIPDAEIGAFRAWSSTASKAPCPESDTSHSRDRAHWLLPDAQNVEGFGGRHLVARLAHAREYIGYVTVYRPADAAGFGEETIESLLALVPHLSCVLALALRVAAAEGRSWQCTQCSEMHPFGCILVDSTGSILEMNAIASEFVAAQDGLRVSESHLQAIRAEESTLLDRRLGEILGDVSPARAEFVTIPRPSGRRRYAIFIRRMAARPSAFTLRVPSARLVIIDTDRGTHVPRQVMRAVYELTETESRVAWQLAEGGTLDQVAARLGIAHNTLRHHLERIFQKTGTHRQADLVRMLQAPFVSVGGAD